ncbi:MAG TPA: OsmC family protein [Gemmatimonadaceae bacterium]|nr:OsmC family protein [Gemmatimonadaceae bacterium]
MTTPAPKPPARPSTGNPIVKSHAVWKGGLLYEAGVGERTHLIDGNSKAAPSPVETLVSSLGTCAASDVVEILAKQRTPPERLEVDTVGTRRAEFPRRLLAVELTLTIEGAGITREQVERAMTLSVEKYCTVAASLAGDITFTSVIVLNGERGDPVLQPMFSAK